jgi:hypothetical protein
LQTMPPGRPKLQRIFESAAYTRYRGWPEAAKALLWT